MSKKVVVLNEKTRVLFNECKGIVLRRVPQENKITDDKALYIMLESFKKWS